MKKPTFKEFLTEGYEVLPPMDHDKYPNREREGLEGPFTARNGKVLYYDPKAGMYYDPLTDIYLSYDEWLEMDMTSAQWREKNLGK